MTKQISVRIRHESPHENTDRHRQTGRRFTIRAGKPLRQRSLRVLAQLVDLGNTMDTADRAKRRALLYAVVLAPQIIAAVLLQRNARMAALLGTPVDEAVLTDVQIPAAGAAVPAVRPAVRQVLLKPVVIREVEQRLA